MKKLSISQLCSVSMMLFAIFFGAGNMIFPPAMGQLAGEHYLSALAGFILTDAGIAILGVTAVVLVGNSMSDLGNLVGKRFAFVLSIGVYLLIGPLFALPRTGSVSYEIAVLPYIKGSASSLTCLLFTAIFFAVTYYLSSNPNKIVDVVGKYLTPILLLCIASIFIVSLFKGYDGDQLAFGTMGKPQGDYAVIPFFKGMIEGYNALDGPAGIAFAILVIQAIRSFGVKEKKSIARYTILCGFGAAMFLALVYFALTYVGAITQTPFANGGNLLHAVTIHLFGDIGGVILGIAVLFACLTTSIGLTTSFSDYFQELMPTLSYKKIAFCVCFFSFLIANVGLSQLISISLPILIILYPVTVILILLSFFKKWIKDRRMVYILAMLFTFLVSFANGLESVGIHCALFDPLHQLPFYDLSIGWILPGIFGAVLGALPFWQKHSLQHITSNHS